MAHAVQIEGMRFSSTQFAYDGCHKIYLLSSWRDEREAAEAEGMGYEILPVEELEETYEGSCPLRFIGCWDLVATPVPQFLEEDRGRSPEIRVI